MLSIRFRRVIVVILFASLGIAGCAPAEAHKQTRYTRNIFVRVVEFVSPTKAVITVESQRQRTREIACWSHTDLGGDVGGSRGLKSGTPSE